MYRVIIADDEESVRSRLKSILTKLSDQFEVVGCFENGYDASENGISLAPDILITDIRMPYVDGIDLIKHFKRELPLIQSIIVSGYDSFDYAKEAISLGVVGYLTKPVFKDELLSTLNKAKEILDNQYHKDRNRKNLEQKARDSVRFLQSEDLNLLIKVKEISDNFNGKLVEDGIDLNHKYQRIIVFDSDKEDLGFEQQDLFYFFLKKNIDKEFGEGRFTYYQFLNDNQFVLLLESDKRVNSEELILSLNSILARVKRGGNISVSCGVSDIRKKPINYRKLFRHAKRSLEYRTVLGQNMVFSFADLEKEENDSGNSGKVDENEYRNLTYFLSYGKKEEAEEKIKKLILQISTPKYKENYNYILSNILDALLKACISLNDFYLGFDSHIEIRDTLYRIKTPTSLIEYYYQIAERVIKVNESKRLSGLESSYERIQKFLEANFTNPGLSIDDVANELAYSVSYISAILKKNGKSFTKRMTELRRKKALDLLSNANNRIITIARDVGYADPYYFSHCFKKYTGRSPDDYRKKKLS